MKKILIMLMSCNDVFFNQEEDICKQTWLSNISKFNNIKYVIYKGDENILKHKYQKGIHTLTLRCEDDLDHTFKKTYYAFKLADKIFDYDYIFRTNTSNYVNIELLNYFIQHIEDDNVVWSSDLYSLSNSFCPYPLYIYGRGNGVIYSRKHIDIILKEGISFLYLKKTCDDWIIGNILNSYWIKEGKDYLDYIKGYPHGWYKCIPNEDVINNHKLCKYGNMNSDWDFINKFITIQIKVYHDDRNKELNNYKEFYNNVKNKEYTEEEIKKIYDYIIEYSKSPSVFIGSILGYADYNEWKNCNKMNLYNYQIQHKASDDEECGKMTKWL